MKELSALKRINLLQRMAHFVLPRVNTRFAYAKPDAILRPRWIRCERFFYLDAGGISHPVGCECELVQLRNCISGFRVDGPNCELVVSCNIEMLCSFDFIMMIKRCQS